MYAMYVCMFACVYGQEQSLVIGYDGRDKTNAS